MGILRLASKQNKRLELGEGDWLDVVSDLTKRDFNSLLKSLPQSYTEDGMTPGQADDFATSLFSSLVRGWSLDVPVSEDAYLDLPRDAAIAVDVALIEHFNTFTPDAKEADKSEDAGK